MWIYKVVVSMYNEYAYTRIGEDEGVDENVDSSNDKKFISVGVQTDVVGYTSFNLNSNDNISDNLLDLEDSFFKHLTFANQSYFEHFQDALKYSLTSLTASFYFFIHAVWPDIYTRTGSDTIHELSTLIYDKYAKRINEINETRSNS
jgi:hypothetical protein